MKNKVTKAVLKRILEPVLDALAMNEEITDFCLRPLILSHFKYETGESNPEWEWSDKETVTSYLQETLPDHHIDVWGWYK